MSETRRVDAPFKGDRILITDDPSKSRSVIGRAGWHPARVSRGVTTATVQGVSVDKYTKDQRPHTYKVITDVGEVPSLKPTQVFLIA
ncbi:hypothetical protein AB0B66_10425 [Catellatospora sp. NPDC049111]|uniref:hypothetical protein n=1 Tax=Catellatospora sp. NPDC049111 TaxID=3155271 RepID=UPI0033C99AEA